MSRLVHVGLDMEVEVCGSCGGSYGLPKGFLDRKRSDKKKWFCPFCGTTWRYRRGTEDELRDELARERKRREAEEAAVARLRRSLDMTQDRLETEQRRRAGLKGYVTRIKRRIGAGKCPCCKADFHDLGAHMRAAHPDFTEEQDDG